MPAYQRAITIGHANIPSNLSNFPTMVAGTFSWLATTAHGGHVLNSSGFDIYFTSDAAGTNLLYFERVAYNPTTGACEFWVNLPSISSTVDTIFYINYGDSTVTSDISNRNSTWNSSFQGVWHFGDGVTLDLTDSTSNGNNGTNVNGATATTSPFGFGGGQGAVNLNSASSQHIGIGTPSSLNISGPITIEFCYTGVSGGTFIGKGSPSSTGFDATTGQNFLGQATSQSLFAGNTGANSAYRAYTYDNVDTVQGFLFFSGFGGGWGATSPTSWGANAIGNNALVSLVIGAKSDGTNGYNGPIDEVRISNVVRSPDWLHVSSLQLGINGVGGTIISIGTEGTVGGGGATPSIILSPSAGYQGYAYSISVTGSNTHFVNGTTAVSISGTGATITGVSVTSPSSLTFTLTLSGSATLGARIVTVTTGSEAPTAGFTVISSSLVPDGDIAWSQVRVAGPEGNGRFGIGICGQSCDGFAGTPGSSPIYAADGKTLTPGSTVGAGGAAPGITALTGDVTATGPGSAAASVVGLRGRPVSATAPTSNQGLVWNGSLWIPTSLLSNPMTTKGDLIVGGVSGATTRLGVGSDGQVLTLDSTQTLGVKWASGSNPYANPPSSGWSWDVQGGSTVNSTSGSSIFMTAAQYSAGVRAYYRTAPSTPYTVTAAFCYDWVAGQDVALDFGFRDSSGKYIMWHIASGTSYVFKFGASNSPSAAYGSFPTNIIYNQPIWLQVSDDGTNLIFRYRLDSQGPWIAFQTQSRTNYMTSGPNALMWGGYTNGGQVLVDLISWA